MEVQVMENTPGMRPPFSWENLPTPEVDGV